MVAYFLRHADAELRVNSDHERILSPKGVEQAERAGKFMVRCGLLPEIVLSSPLVRARQTAQIVAANFGGASLSEVDWLACGMETETCLAELKAREQKASILLVGHEPDFSETISAMLGLDDAASIKVRKASLTGVEVTDFRPGQAELHFLVPSKFM